MVNPISFISGRVPYHAIQVVGRRSSPLKVVAVVSIFFFIGLGRVPSNTILRSGAVHPFKLIEVVAIVNCLCWFIKACIPHHPKEWDGDLLPFEVVVVVVVISIFLHCFRRILPQTAQGRGGRLSPLKVGGWYFPYFYWFRDSSIPQHRSGWVGDHRPL